MENLILSSSKLAALIQKFREDFSGFVGLWDQKAVTCSRSTFDVTVWDIGQDPAKARAVFKGHDWFPKTALFYEDKVIR